MGSACVYKHKKESGIQAYARQLFNLFMILQILTSVKEITLVT